jgi:hypothetical protein
MKSETFPLAMPADLLEEVRQAAKRTGLSMADVVRQSAKIGLPKLVEDFALRSIKPLSPEECRRCFDQPNPEFDALEAHMATIPPPPPDFED